MRPVRVATSVLAVVLLGIWGSAAQSRIVLSSLGIDLWPDYDRPGVLVIYHATIAPDASLPARLEFRIPAAAGLPSAVAERPANGQLMTLPYERTVQGETARIAVTTSQMFVQLEYYDAAITRDGARRRFAFTWPGDFEVRDLSISLQQPHLAENFTTVPAATTVAASADGLMYHTLSRAGVTVGTIVKVQASYEKASEQLSVATIAPVAAPTPAPAAAPANAATSNNSTMLIVMEAMLVCAAAVIIGWMIQTQRRARSAPRSTPPTHAASTDARGGKATRFCTQCGAGVEGGDRFCQRCGAALKAS
ncbi:MAG: zinc ribbon domain-containing protein [Vicinamibacterales bacterium]